MQKSISTTLMIILFSIVSNAQNNPYNNYQKDWKQVEQFELDNLPKSALEIVETIYKKAKNDTNSPQIVKALLYKSKFALILQEDAELKVVDDLKQEIADNAFPVKNMLHSILADLYWQYFQQNRWKFYNRTHTEEKVDSSDFRTWDLQTLFEETQRQYEKSLAGGLLLQQENLRVFNDILNLQEGSQKYRPTLYDFLAHRALDFYKTDESNLQQPAYKFEIDNPGYLGGNATFLEQPFTAKDSLSQKLLALKLYKTLTLFHRQDNQPDALVDLTLERLDFVKSNAIFNDVNSIYLNTLNDLKKQFPDKEIVTQIDFKIASLLNEQAGEYTTGTDETNRWKRKEALAVCEEAIRKFPESNGAKNCKALKSNILTATFSITTENYVPLNKKSRLLVSYKNLDSLHLQILPVSQKQYLKFRDIYNDSARIAFIKKLNLLKSWIVQLKNEQDYQEHSSELIVPELDPGQYLIVASPEAHPEAGSSYAYGFVQATDLALIENNLQSNYLYQVVDRNTGAPISGARLHFKNNAGRYDRSFDNIFTSDNRGFVAVRPNDYYSNITIGITYKKDMAFFGEYYLSKGYPRQKQSYDQNRVFLFTDRGIYRPGQTVYFKGIAVAMKDNRSDVLSGKKVIVNLRDVNYQVVQSLEFKTNEFGSFSGQFILPASGLTGNFTINASGDTSVLNKNMNGSVSFSVEEYKRPKVEAEFLPVTGTYHVNDSVSVAGKATAYAGSNITGAKVVYRVMRTAQFPEWYWYRRPAYNSEDMEITHGETLTDSQGTFKIDFRAIPDSKFNRDSHPVFNYAITADITDVNGETRSVSTNVKVGYHMLNVLITTDFDLDKKQKDHEVSISTTNLNGQSVPVEGKFSIYKVEAPQQALRKRPWPAPDYQLIPEGPFKEMFPHDAYRNEDVVYNRKKGKLVFSKDVATEKSGQISLKNMAHWESGNYVMVFECTDSFGQEVKDEKFVTVYGDSDKKLADKELFKIQTDKKDYQPGNLAIIDIGSASDAISVILNIEKGDRTDTRIVHLSDDIKTITLPIEEADRGGFTVNYYYVNYNAFNSGRLLVKVPYPSTELSIETNSFRDKLQPGQEETWSFTVKGPKGDKVSAELLASMYDASLDQFRSNYWSFNPIYRPYKYSYNRANANHSFGTDTFKLINNYPSDGYYYQDYDQLNWFGLSFGPNYSVVLRGKVSGIEITGNEGDLEEVVTVGYGKSKREAQLAPPVMAEANYGFVTPEDKTPDNQNKNDSIPHNNGESLEGISIRKNLQETAFFYPLLTTDKEGNVSFNFTAPESLTRWKLQLLAHTKTLESATKELSAVTQKDLMVLPNPPRFFRQGDTIVFASKIANLSDKGLNGVAQLQLFDALTNKPIDNELGNSENTRNFAVDAKGNTNLNWTLTIPDDVQAVKYRIVAKAGTFSDGEENALPVLSNRMLVTETLPMWVRSGQTKTFVLNKLKDNTSATLKNYNLSLEVTSNPAWYAVQALPYLMEYPYECAEQTFSRYYANALGSHIANSNPRIREVFNQWKNSDALLSNLEKNEELKSLIIQETPWLREAQSETEQKKRIALLFDLNKMSNELQAALRKLEQMQMNNGGFPWFKGSRYPSRYITQHIAAGFGHLKKLNVNSSPVDNSMIHRAVGFLDNEILNDYRELEKQGKRIRESAKTKTEGAKKEAEFWAQNHTGNIQIQYLYMRSFYTAIPFDSKVKKAVDYYTGQTSKYWKDYDLYSTGMVALIAYRNKDKVLAEKIFASLKENAVNSDELGMYWKANTAGWYWYRAPIETQALMIEAFSEISGDIKVVDELKVWLLKNKQTNSWKTTKATTEAVYALLLRGTDWLETSDLVTIAIGNETIDPLQLEDTKVEAGTGYFKTSWKGSEIKPDMASVTLSKPSEGIAWGALYWQYFENLDKITFADTPLKLKKKLFLKKNTDTGEELSEITAKTALHLGDLVRVRIELRVDRDMEFIHMKDMRAAGFEPVNVLSQYKYQDGLGYYESTKDAATNFFFDYLPKGVYVFEYDLRANNTGDFSNGITTIQSMYAPEFSSHSEGVRVKVK